MCPRVDTQPKDPHHHSRGYWAVLMRFNTWLDEELAPQDANSLVIMDNARIETQALIQAHRCYTYLLIRHPVEHKFANIKKLRSYNG